MYTTDFDFPSFDPSTGVARPIPTWRKICFPNAIVACNFLNISSFNTHKTANHQPSVTEIYTPSTVKK